MWESYTFDWPSGVPQGSNLGPMLFLLFINDITNTIRHSYILLYADDIKLHKEFKTQEDSELLQQDLDKLANWSIENCLPFNIKKCESITFTRKWNPFSFIYKTEGKQLIKVTEVRDVGVLLDSRLTFRSHILKIFVKSKQMLGFTIRNSKHFQNFTTMKVLYFSLVRSRLEFASIIWHPSTKSSTKKIEAIQKKFLKYPHLDYSDMTRKIYHTTNFYLDLKKKA